MSILNILIHWTPKELVLVGIMLLNALVNWVEWRDRPYSRGRVFFTTICCLIAAIFSIGTEYLWSDKNGDGYYGFALTLGILLAWFGSFSKRNVSGSG